MNPTKPSSYEMHRAELRKAFDRSERAEAELERVKKAYGERVKEINELLLERDTARKVCAEMREALEQVVHGPENAWHQWLYKRDKALSHAKEALFPTIPATGNPITQQEMEDKE